MSDNLVQNYFSIIEHLLDDALCASANSETSITSEKVQLRLSETLIQLQADIENGKIVLTKEDKSRLTSIMEKLATLESHTHAHLSWFDDLSKRIQRQNDT